MINKKRKKNVKCTSTTPSLGSSLTTDDPLDLSSGLKITSESPLDLLKAIGSRFKVSSQYDSSAQWYKLIVMRYNQIMNVDLVKKRKSISVAQISKALKKFQSGVHMYQQPDIFEASGL
ncbi:hypothetical protein HDU67_004642 [Dinochytrium kinnereticum]|nr:hypothetical protein HDU67_004642 [Dinochytrium kinnereticum]